MGMPCAGSYRPRIWDAAATMASAWLTGLLLTGRFRQRLISIATHLEWQAQLDCCSVTCGPGTMGCRWIARTLSSLAVGSRRSIYCAIVIRTCHAVWIFFQLVGLKRICKRMPSFQSPTSRGLYKDTTLGPVVSFIRIPLVLAYGTLQALARGKSKLSRSAVLQLIQDIHSTDLVWLFFLIGCCDKKEGFDERDV